MKYSIIIVLATVVLSQGYADAQGYDYVPRPNLVPKTREVCTPHGGVSFCEQRPFYEDADCQKVHPDHYFQCITDNMPDPMSGGSSSGPNINIENNIHIHND
jgi:hypothetical protein